MRFNHSNAIKCNPMQSNAIQCNPMQSNAIKSRFDKHLLEYSLLCSRRGTKQPSCIIIIVVAVAVVVVAVKDVGNIVI